jgi:nucleoside-diphosphate-sugar epimerase
MKTAFIAGATGYTGRHVVEQLVNRGVSAVAHIRSDSGNAGRWIDRFEKMGAKIDRTPWDPAALSKTFTGLKPDMIFALLGTTRARIKDAASQGVKAESVDYMAVDYGLTSMLIRAAVDAGASPRFIYLSAVGAGEKSRSAYYIARFKAESELIASGLPYVIARPSFITGPDRDGNRPMEKFIAKIGDAALGAASSIPGLGVTTRRYRSITGSDLAKSLIDSALAQDWMNRIVERENL